MYTRYIFNKMNSSINEIIFKSTSEMPYEARIDALKQNTLDVINHIDFEKSKQFLNIEEIWINDGAFHLWPMKSFMIVGADISHTKRTDKSIVNCEYVFASIKAILVECNDETNSNFIYFYGRCVINPKDSTKNWIFHDWNWQSSDLKHNIKPNMTSNKKNSRNCCVFDCAIC
jgi:hypothetical protein